MNRIIFLEDEPLFSELVKRFHDLTPKVFSREMELVALKTVAMMRHVVDSGPVALIIWDLTLPDSTQEMSMETIGREHHTLPMIYVLTGDERMEVRDKCLQMGAAGFAIKKHVVESPNYFFANIYNEYVKRLQNG